MTEQGNVKEIAIADDVDREDLFGTLDCNLRMIEEATGSELIQRGSRLVIKGGDADLAEGIVKELSAMLEKGEKFDEVITIGPLIMMKFVVATTKPFDVPCTVSMNPIMIDGTGMCGGCRLTLNQDGKKVTKFACVDGPDFNGYEVDFDEAMSRNRMYMEFERHAYEEACNLFKEVR